MGHVRNQIYGLSEESEKWDCNQRSFHGMATDGSLRWTAGKHAACGCAVVQIELDGGEEPWYGVPGNMLIELEVRRTTKRAEIWALYMALCRLSWPAELW